MKRSICSSDARPTTIGTWIGKYAIVRHVLGGGTAAVVHFGTYYALTALSVNYNLAFTVGVALSLAFNFVASSRFTFRTGLSAGRGLRFCGAHAVNYLLSIGLLNLYVRLGVSEYVAPLLVWPVAVPINYLMVRYSLTGGAGRRSEGSDTRKPISE